MNEPIDTLHRECLDARSRIRDEYHDLRIKAGLWEPRPIPKDWR